MAELSDAKSIYAELAADLSALTEQSRRRSLESIARSERLIELGDRTLVNLAGNDYLALSQHPHLKEAAKAAIDADGTGAGASRLISGTLTRHQALEARFATFKHAEAALLLPSGYLANLSVLTALAGPGDVICLDKLNHASLIDAARLSGATVRTFPHRHYDKLARLLDRHAASGQTAPAEGQKRAAHPSRLFIVTDSVFSMDGDCADLPRLAALADQYDAMLIVDEAHATGLLGDTGAGLCEAQGVADQVDVVISTASKALGSLGGVVTGTQVVIDTLINHARPAIYTTAAAPAQAGAIEAALDVIEQEPARRERLAALTRRVRSAVAALGWAASDAGDEAAAPPVPIVPIVVGDPTRALALSRHLREAGILAAAIRYPTVPPGADRVRLSLRADLTDADIDQLTEALARFQ